MDPNKTLAEIRRLVGRLDRDSSELGTLIDDVFALCELTTALDEWLSNGGFLPLAWENFGGAKTGGQPTR